MKKTMKVAVSMLLVFMLCVSLSACGGKSIEGTWTMEEEGQVVEFTFEKDGVGKIAMPGVTIDFTYTIDGDKLETKMSAGGEEEIDISRFEIDGDKLTMFTLNEDGTDNTDIPSTELTRKK